jgi:site-specific DNA-methyltransferase (adenine-specific)
MNIESTNGQLPITPDITYSECHAQVSSRIFLGDCLIEMDKIESGSVDLILTDLPYKKTDCKWDKIIDPVKLWKQFERIIKTNGVICLTANEPFTSILVCSKIEWYRHRWIWEKDKSANIFLTKSQPLKKTEDVVVFSKVGFQKSWNDKSIKSNYYPQMEMTSVPRIETGRKKGKSMSEINNRPKETRYKTDPNKDPNSRFPKEIIYFPVPYKDRVHPTQKPVELMQYLINTYTNENETVLDCCMGSGTTGVACKNINRKFIGIEKDESYFKIAEQRINARMLLQKERLID